MVSFFTTIVIAGMGFFTGKVFSFQVGNSIYGVNDFLMWSVMMMTLETFTHLDPKLPVAFYSLQMLTILSASLPSQSSWGDSTTTTPPW